MLVFIDMFSRYAEIFPCTGMSVDVLKEKPVKFMVRYGLSGPQFESEEYHNQVSKLRIKKLRTTAYHPAGNGLCARFNKTLQNELLALRLQHQKSTSGWSCLLPTALLNYRTTMYSSTGYSPAELFVSFSMKTIATRLHLDRYRFSKANQ
jgi:transposase InsO family protein